MNLIYPIEILKKSVEKLNHKNLLKSKYPESSYHLSKIKQMFEAIELLQKEHLKTDSNKHKENQEMIIQNIKLKDILKLLVLPENEGGAIDRKMARAQALDLLEK